MSEGLFMANVFMWAWKAGIDVSLISKSFEVPFKHNQFQMPRGRADYPVFRFSRGDNHIECMGRDFDDLVKTLKFKLPHIHVELVCPPFGDL